MMILNILVLAATFGVGLIVPSPLFGLGLGLVRANINIAAATPPNHPICSEVPYPQLCNNTPLVGMASSIHDNVHVRDSAIGITLDLAQRAHRLISAMDLSSSFDHPGAKLAWADCLEMYEDIVYQLNRSIGCNSPNSVQTWLSAALTNQQMCRDGFAEFNLSSDRYLHSSLPAATGYTMLTDLSRLLSNCLAINKQLQQQQQQQAKTHSRRRLLQLSRHGFPEWLPAADRKLLLESPSGGQRVDIVVAQDGSANYKTISEAVAASASLRRSGDQRFVIHVKAGVYREKIEIRRSMRNLMFVGDGIGATVVTGDRNMGDGGSTTYSSATFGISGDGFIARDMTFENTAGPEKQQAVAVRCGGDFSVFFRCSFTGYQDTLFVISQRQFYRLCDIYGTIDFIFGNAVAVLQNCNIYVRKPLSHQQNVITAQGRSDPNQDTGIIVHNSIVKAAGDLEAMVGQYKTYLGRPWQKYSRAVFMKCDLDRLIDPKGWLPWEGSFGLSTLYYGEYMNRGAGAATGGRVGWGGYHVISSPTEAQKFTVANFLAGGAWISAAGVPFTSGL